MLWVYHCAYVTLQEAYIEASLRTNSPREGIETVVVAVAAFWLIHNYPDVLTRPDSSQRMGAKASAPALPPTTISPEGNASRGVVPLKAPRLTQGLAVWAELPHHESVAVYRVAVPGA
jgi:hypothetical protein